MKSRTLVVHLVLALILVLASNAEAKTLHLFDCNDCHTKGAGITLDLGNNICMACHKSGVGAQVDLNFNSVSPQGRFETIDASNQMGTVGNLYNVTPTDQTSHLWANITDTVPAAGAQAPVHKSFYGNNNLSGGLLTCSRCHDPHAETATNPKATKIPNDQDQMCKDCHRAWNQSDNQGLLAHPMVTDYNTVATGENYNAVLAGKPERFIVPPVFDSSDMRLVGGISVSCTTCHGVHFTDSDSTTVDGMLSTQNAGDGHQLRADGPTQPDKAGLCQSCHAYALHGDDGTKGTAERVGCMVCHSGHSYNDGVVVNYYMLRKDSLPTGKGTATNVSYTQAPGTYTAPMPYNDGLSISTGGICEKCHGDAEAIPKGVSGTHNANDRCLDCHYHYDATYSFKPDQSAASCGDCHGFPPHINARGDRKNLGTDGGYAYDPATDWNYGPDPDFKFEDQTAHLSHAGYAFNTNYYRYTNCNDCHGVDSGVNAVHNDQRGYASYRDVPFGGIADAGGSLSPQYDTAAPDIWTCSNVYCHSNGGPRNATHTRQYNAGSILTPAWDQASGGGLNYLIGAADQNVRCSSCHGNSSSSMTTKGNSPAHGKHLAAGISCEVCHSATAAGSSSLVAGATDVKTGGDHVNGSINVVLSTSAVNGGLVPTDYDPSQGTCATYCHDFAGVDPLIDWQDDTTTCGSCHGVTAASLTSGSHAIHIDAAMADVSCDACHGTNASSGTHAGHVDGVVTKLATSSSCDVCHGIENTAAWDVSPTWGNGGSIDCRTCHTGAVTTGYSKAGGGSVTAPAKANASTTGHNRPTASGAYGVTGVAAANKNCSDCHDSIGSGHVDGLGNGDILLAGFSCEACHTAAGAWSVQATVRVKTHSNTDPTYTNQKRADFTKLCVACHDPHGTSNAAMIENLASVQNAKDGIGNFGGDVVFSAFTGADSFDESDAANLDDICATCHTTTTHNNQSASGTHREGENCLTCHGHDGSLGGFMPTGGNACNDCHGNPPTASDDRPAGTAGAHEFHTSVASHLEDEDMTDCDVCHPGAASYTLGHSNGSVELAAGITNATCASACHLSTVSDGTWTDADGLTCDACHYYEEANPTAANNTGHAKSLSDDHGKHFDSGKLCTDCHANNALDVMSPHAHIDDHEAFSLNGTNDGSVVQDRGAASQDEATVVVSTWNDGTDTCGNAACHNPSAGAYSATWMVSDSTGNCDFCHSSSDPGTGSHSAHLSATLSNTFGITIGCAGCHIDNGTNTGHLDGSIGFDGTITWATPTCTASACHQNGKGTNVNSPDWGVSSPNCSICHAAPPATGRHAEHVANTSYVTASCGSCHANATATTITAATHIDASVQTGVEITAHTQGSATCTNTCHAVDATGTWADTNTLDCIECHSSGKSAGGSVPTSGLHTGPLTISGNTHDDSFQVVRGEATPSGTCLTCHSGIDLASDLPATHIAGGAPSASEAALATDLNHVTGSPSTCSPGAGFAGCHDDGGAWARRWNATAKLSDDSECGNCHGDFDRTWVGGVILRHSGDAQVEAGHDGVDKCYMCHTYKKGQTVPYDFAVKHRDGTIQLNDDMLFTDNGGATNTCNGCHDSGAGPYGLADGEYGFTDTNKDDAADGGVDRWSREMVVGGPAGNCNGCHVSAGRDHTGANENNAVHTYHTGSPMSPGCGACHPADSGPGGALHENNTVDFGGTYLTTALNYTGADFTNTNCSTANGCHDSGEGSWVADTLATCGDCHAATGKLLDQGGYPPVSNAHGAHLGNAAYVGTVGVDACDACHGAGSSVSNHLAAHNDGNVTVTNAITAYTLLASAGDGTCTNTCHTVASGRDWDGGTLMCVDCHQNAGDIGKVNKDNTSGLHQAATALAHNDAFPRPNSAPDGTCTSCHTNIDLATPVTHVDGSALDPNTAFGLFASYATGASTCSGAGVATDCHSDGGDWTRLWNTAVDAKPLATDDPTSATVCRNCHGSFAEGWNSLSTSHVDPDLDNSGDQMQAGGHLVCEKCHGWGNAAYDRNWGGASPAHGDGFISMNGPVGTGTGYNDATGGCDTVNCHGGQDLTLSTASGWTANYGDFGGAGACGACHDDGTIPPNSGAHAAHGANGDGDYSECEACHGTDNGGDWATGSGGSHNTGTVNFAAGITYSDNLTPGTNLAAADDTCATTICHSPSGLEATWGTPASVGCNACHYDGSSGNALSNDHDKHLGAGFVCTDCHADNSGDTTAPRSHMDATGGLVDKATALQNEATLIAGALGATGTDPTEAAPGNPTCDNSQCHNPSGGYSATWMTDAASCSLCHSATDPATGSHSQHMAAATTFGLNVACADCHVDNGVNTAHRDGSVGFNGSTTYASLSCSASLCHESSVGTDVPSPNWGSDGPISCSICHANQPNSGAHTTHFTGTYGPNTGTDCGICHAANANNSSMSGQAAHIDATVTLADGNPLGSSASCDACHGGATPAGTAKTNWPGATGVTCESCHGDYTPAVINGTSAPVRAGSAYDSTGHGKAGVAQACAACHDELSAHISGALGQNRLDLIGGADFGVDPNGFCTNCHEVTNVEKAHKEDIGDNLSDDAHQCAICHDMHGQNGGMDAMIRSTIGGKIVTGFSDKAAAGSYYVATPNNGGNNQYGICQVCHAASDADAGGGVINYFNMTANADSGHAAQGTCTTCHAHTDDPAFLPGAEGCTGCHGDGVNNKWPDSSTAHEANQDGVHTIHVNAIAGYGLTTANDSCDYCHPSNTHGGADSVVPADVSQTDVDGNGTVDVETGTYFKYIVSGATDSDGRYDRTGDGRCSNIDCHANAPYTPGWYGDTVAPDPVGSLTTVNDNYSTVTINGKSFYAEEDEPYSVLLKWTAPGDDNGVDGTAHRYEVRYRTDAAFATDGSNWDTGTIAGGPPSMDRASKEQAMIVHGLPNNTGQTYYFGVKTFDEVGNVSTVAATGTQVAPHPDEFPPEFWGIDTAKAADDGQTVEVSWTAAKDHTPPVTYDLWWSTTPINYNSAVMGSTGSLKYRVTSLTNGIPYYFGVRAKDSASPAKVDTNTSALVTLPEAPPEKTKTPAPYTAGGAGTPVNLTAGTGYVGGSGSSSTFPLNFRVGSTYAVDTKVFGNSFVVYIANANTDTGQATAELGYWDTQFRSFTTPVTAVVNLTKRAKKVITFKLDGSGVITSGNRLAVQIRDSGNQGFTVSWGDATNKGDLYVSEQAYNQLPNACTGPSVTGTSGLIDIAWTEAGTLDPNGDAIHYDVYANCTEDGGATYTDYIVAKNQLAGTTSVTWDSLSDGVGLSGDASCTASIHIGDGFADGDGNGISHTVVPAGSWTVNNQADSVFPAAVSDLQAETRPKQGSVYLHWTAVGDDGLNHGSRASYYDIRYVDIGTDLVATWNTANQATGEPVPAFSGTTEGFELLLPAHETSYSIGMKVCDEADNCSGISNVVSAISGPKCGVCHSTPPDENATAGNHAKHGYTMDDCANCHGTGAATYAMNHQDGNLVLGFNTASPAVAYRSGTRVYYTNDGQPDPGDKSNVIYDDPDGPGGFNFISGDNGYDDGTCSNTIGCHGPASPSWSDAATLNCSDCHGAYTGYSAPDGGNTVNPNWRHDRSLDAYGRPYDDSSEDIQASPPVDLSGLDGGTTVGQHLKHLNSSFRFSKGDSCRLCHIDSNHADGIVDVRLDPVGAGENALYNTAAPLGVSGGVTCTGTTDTGCHGNPATQPEWSDQATVSCENCHHMGGALPPHIKDGGIERECSWCHVEGHPQEGAATGTLMIPNHADPNLGLNYKSGGVHLRTTINGRGPFATEAEICWGCHDAQTPKISEWNGDDAPLNTDNYGYDFGYLDQSNWVGATWTSGTAAFGYKTGLIQSTHTANPAGQAAIAWNATGVRYDETPDTVDKIRCSWCHDVHNLNLAKNDNDNGAPFLRGSWRGNPYKEDGAPQQGTTYIESTTDLTIGANYGVVPRSGADTTTMGGYWIDQNSGNPTAGWDMGNSAGLCVLCHGSDPKNLDQVDDGNLWLGATNGHNNATVGGDGLGATNIFRNSWRNGDGSWNNGMWMGYQNIVTVRTSSKPTYGGGLRNVDYGDGVLPGVNGKPEIGDLGFAWGVAVDDITTETGVHNFSCSKCHNPHASRLPKLMITNCLDTRHATWAITYNGDADWSIWRTGYSYGTNWLPFASTAQNCHRYVDVTNDGTAEEPGWNKVTPWSLDNKNNVKHGY